MTDLNSEDQAFQKLDAEKLKQEISGQIKEEVIRAAKKSLIEDIQGTKKQYSWEQKGKSSPSDYDELFGETDSRYVKKEEVDKYAETVVEKKLRERDEFLQKQQEKETKKQYENIESRRKAFDSEWYALVSEGKVPSPAKEIQERINKGDKLSKEEIMADEGLRARLELANIVQSTGKSAKLAFYEDFNKQPAGARAPVIGGRPSVPNKSDDEGFTYDDVKKARKKFFGF